MDFYSSDLPDLKIDTLPEVKQDQPSALLLEHILTLEKNDLKAAEEIWQSLPAETRLRLVLQTSSARDKENLILLDQNAQRLVQSLPPD